MDDPPKTRQRGDATRAAILAAAQKRFADESFERATIRAIAADAGVDPALVMRYYGNKDKLFAVAATFDLRLPDFTRIPRRRVGAAMAEHFLAVWEESDGLRILLRTAMTHEAGAERMRAMFAAQVRPGIAPVCDPPESADLRVALAASQLLGVAVARYLLQAPPLARLDRASLVRLLAPTLQRYVVGKLDGPD